MWRREPINNKMKNEPINEPIKKIKKINSIQIDSIAIK